jgi:hypothetical protein
MPLWKAGTFVVTNNPVTEALFAIWGQLNPAVSPPLTSGAHITALPPAQHTQGTHASDRSLWRASGR